MVENYSASILTSGESSNFASKGSKRAKIAFSRGGLNKGHPIRTRITRSKSSLGHFLTLVDNSKGNIFCINHFALITKEIVVFSQFLPLVDSFFHIFGSSSPWDG